MTLNSKHNKWLQFLAEEDFPPKLLWSENADLKFSVNNEGKKTSIRNRGVERTSLSTAKATRDNKRQSNRLEKRRKILHRYYFKSECL